MFRLYVMPVVAYCFLLSAVVMSCSGGLMTLAGLSQSHKHTQSPNNAAHLSTCMATCLFAHSAEAMGDNRRAQLDDLFRSVDAQLNDDQRALLGRHAVREALVAEDAFARSILESFTYDQLVAFGPPITRGVARALKDVFRGKPVHTESVL
jgi:hypothetical protein